MPLKEFCSCGSALGKIIECDRIVHHFNRCSPQIVWVPDEPAELQTLQSQLAIAKEALLNVIGGPIAFWNRSKPYSREFDLVMQDCAEKAREALRDIETILKGKIEKNE